jgi:hypothetical protein
MTDRDLSLRQVQEIGMPLFHFNSRTGDEVLPDAEGEELPNVSAACEVAIASAREALIEAVKTRDTPPDCIHVTDSDGRDVVIIFVAALAAHS